LLATLFGSRMGAEVVGIDPSADRRALASQLGARRTFDPIAGPIGEQVKACYPGGADKLFEASGAASAHATIPDLLRPLGMAALVGLGNAEVKMSLSAVVHRELVVFGTSAFPTSQYDEIWRFLRRHAIAPTQVSCPHRMMVILRRPVPGARSAGAFTAVGDACAYFAPLSRCSTRSRAASARVCRSARPTPAYGYC